MSNVQTGLSELQLVCYQFNECTYKRSPDSIGKTGNFSFQYNYVRNIELVEENTYRVSLQGNVIEPQNNSLELHAEISGIFTVDSADSDMRRGLICWNSLAVLFPMLRSQIILMTVQSGGPQIVLPLMNIRDSFPINPLPGEENID